MIDFGSPLKKAIKFAVVPKRFLPLLVLDLAAFFVLILGLLFNVNELKGFVASLLSDAPSLIGFNLIWFVLGFMVLAGVWGLLRIFVGIVLVRQSYKEKEFGKSWNFAKQKYLTALFAIIIISVISMVVSLIPFIGWLFSIVVSLLFFFTLQCIIINNRGVFESLEESYNIFRTSVLNVIVMFLIISVISFLIVMVFSLPLILAVGMQFSELASFSGDAAAQSMAMMNALSNLFSNLPTLTVAGIIMIFGISISTVFSIKAQTEYFLQLKKKK